MTRNDDTHDDLMPDETNYVERVLLLGTGLVTSLGLAAFAIAQLPFAASAVPELATTPHLLGGSVLVFGLGSGAFALLFGKFLDTLTNSQIKKVSTIHVPVVVLLSVLVDAGAFHPRLAMVFLCLLAGSAILRAIFQGDFDETPNQDI